MSRVSRTEHEANRPAVLDRHRLRLLLGLKVRPHAPPRMSCAHTERLSHSLRLERWMLHAEPEAIPVIAVRPDGPGPFPAVMWAHGHGHDFETGKRILVESHPGYEDPPIGVALARAGFAAFSWDAIGFGERARVAEERWTAEALWHGRAPFGVMIGEAWSVLAGVCALGHIRADRVAVGGKSMGCLVAVTLTAVAPEVAAAVGLCCLVPLRSLIGRGTLGLHAPYFMIPGLLATADMEDVAALIAPRPLLLCAGTGDPLTPPEGLRVVEERLPPVWAAHGARTALRLVNEEGAGHVETAGHRRAVLDVLRQSLLG